MKGSVTFACLLAAGVVVVLVGASAFAQGEGAGERASSPLKALMVENEKKLDEVESLLNQLDAAEVVLEKDVKSLEKALLEYVDGMDKALAAARDSAKKEIVAKEQKMIEDMTKAFEARLKRIDTLHTALAEKVLNATIKLDEAWLNKMIKEQREGYYRSLYPEGRQKVKKAHPELGE
jgi:predicted component of type VI protein secretion system